MRMSSSGERKLLSRNKNLERAFEEMRGKPIIVEGKKDREALRRCGVNGKILIMNGRPQDVCGPLEGEEEAIILTDFDERGEELAEILCECLRSIGVCPNTDCRRRLRYALGIATFQEIDRRLEEHESESRRI